MEKIGILFDLDGTLWDVTYSTYKSANEVSTKYHLQEITKDIVCSVFGKDIIGVAKSYFPNIELDRAIELVNEISNVNVNYLRQHGGKVYPNLKATLDILKEKYDLFIVSNSSNPKYIESFIMTAGLENYFKDYVAASSINITKAEAIKKVISDYHLTKTIYIGDTSLDLEASTLADVPFIQVKYGFGSDLCTKYSINELKELPSMIENILT